MAQVSITVNGRRYEIGCDDGQEEDVRRLGGELDRRVTGMAASVGQVGDARLLVMAGLLMAHELEQARPVGEPPPAGDAPGAAMASGDDDALCDRIERLAARIEAVARSLAPADVP